MKSKTEIFIGILVALAFNIAGIYIYIAIFTSYDIITALKYAYGDSFLGGLLAIGAAANFIPFFVFLKKNKIYRARGVLIFTIIVALFILLLKIEVI